MSDSSAPEASNDSAAADLPADEVLDAAPEDDAATDDDARASDTSTSEESATHQDGATAERVVQGDPDPSPEPARDPDFEGVDITASDGPVLKEGPDLS